LDDLEEVRGWLIVLCLVLLVWQPLQFALAAAAGIEAVRVRGTAVVLVLLVRGGVTAFGAAAGVAIVRRRQAAIRMSITALIAAAVVAVFVELTPFFPTNRIPGDAPLYAAASAVFYGGWVLYVARSSRVRRTLTS
jgi:hypothetical protein